LEEAFKAPLFPAQGSHTPPAGLTFGQQVAHDLGIAHSRCRSGGSS
jgi:hypothetical protein